MNNELKTKQNLVEDPGVKEKITKAIGTADWSNKVIERYNIPLDFPDNYFFPKTPYLQIYVSKGCPFMKAMWERREQIVQKARELGFLECKTNDSLDDGMNMEWKYLSFLTPIRLDDLDEKIGITEDTEDFIGGKTNKSIRNIPLNYIHVSIKNWEIPDRNILIDGFFGGYNLEDFMKEMSATNKRIERLIEIINKGDKED